MDTQVAIIGAGPAGLAAALTLSRSMIDTVVIDAQSPPRNAASPFVAALPGLDKTVPADLRRNIRRDIEAYPYARFENSAVTGLRPEGNGFELRLESGTSLTAEIVLLATGMIDLYPPLEGLEDYWGQSIINCPFCHGIEWSEASWGIYAHRPEVLAAAEIYRHWTSDLTYFVASDVVLDREREQKLLSMGAKLFRDLPVRAHGKDGRLSHVDLPDGKAVNLDCLLVFPHQEQTGIVLDTQVALTETGYVAVDEGYRTSMPGIYAAGDLTYEGHQNTPTALHMGNMAAATIVMDRCFAK